MEKERSLADAKKFMKAQQSDNGPDPLFRAIYPGQSDEWLREAQENFERYLRLVLRIYERIQDDPGAYAQFKRDLEELEKGDLGKGGKVAEKN